MKVLVDAGLVSLMPESFIKENGGEIGDCALRGGVIVGPFANKKRVRARVGRTWVGTVKMAKVVPPGERVYIGDPCYCFDKGWDKVLSNHIWPTTDTGKKHETCSFKQTGGDGSFSLSIDLEDA